MDVRRKSSLSSCSRQGQLWGQTRLWRTWSIWVLKIARGGDSIASLGKLFHCLNVLVVWKLFLYPVWKSLVSAFGHCLFLCHSPVWRAWRSRLSDLLIDIGSWLLGLPQTYLFFRLNMPSSLTLLVGCVLQPPEYLGGPPLNCLSSLLTWLFFIYEHVKSV